MPIIGVEAGAAALTAWLASAIIAGYLTDRIGMAIAPVPMLLVSLTSAAGVWVSLRRRIEHDRPALAAFVAVVGGTFGWLMWRARPDFLPMGSGSDLAHHLSLLRYLEDHRRLVHDATLGAYLGEMIDYTPGAHLLIVLAAGWLGTDALHAVHAVVSATVALKLGILLLIARRLMPDGTPRLPFATVAVLLPWLPYAFFAGSFMEQSFLAQVTAELFAIAAWWTIVVWTERPSPSLMALCGLFSVATFLTWPVWIGPIVLTLGAALVFHGGPEWRTRLRHTAIVFVPIAAVAVVYASGRLVYGFDMVHAVGFAVWPTPAALGWSFIVLAAAGLAWSATDRRARTAAILFAAIALQGAALVATGLNSGATTPYLSLKMCYLAIYPLSVCAAAAIAAAWTHVFTRDGAIRLAWVPTFVAAIGVAGSVALTPRPVPVITQPVYLAGRWARTHLPAGCVDYLVSDGYTGYWLHLAVLGNPRAAGRALEADTFEPRKALVRWILPDGLPYAIAGDFDALPRDIRTSVDVLARFGAAAVVQRRGPTTCR